MKNKLETKVNYYENGQKKEVRNYKNGREEGLQTDWYENGQKKMEGNFKDGMLDGLETEWDEEGKVTKGELV